MSGGGSSRIAANLAMQSMTGGMSKKVILSEMTLSQHEIVFKDVISEYGFVVINRHLTLGEFEGIGWKLVDTIDPAEIEASRVWLMEKGYKNLALWNAEAAFALDRTKADNHINVFAKSNMPRFLQFDYLKPDSNADREGATLFWLPHRELDFPNAPVFHAYTTTDPDKFYGQWSPSGANRWGMDVNLAGSGVHQYAAYYTHCQKMVNYPNFVLKEDELADFYRLDASHLLAGPKGFQRNFNPKHIILEHSFVNASRKACLLFYLRRFGKNLPATYVYERFMQNEAQRVALENKRAEDVADQAVNEDDFDFAYEFAEQISQQPDPEDIVNDVHNHICANCHPDAPCVFWKQEWGAIPMTGMTLLSAEDRLKAMKVPAIEQAEVEVAEGINWEKKTPKSLQECFACLNYLSEQRKAVPEGNKNAKNPHFNRLCKRITYITKTTIPKFQSQQP